jgi:hypothetical protein
VRRAFSTCSFGTAILFVIFLVASAPHRVHHLFEEASASSEHGHSHHAAPSSDSGHEPHPQSRSQQADCALQSLAQNAHLFGVQLLAISFTEFTIEPQLAGPAARLSSFNPAPFSQRAPPDA